MRLLVIHNYSIFKFPSLKVAIYESANCSEIIKCFTIKKPVTISRYELFHKHTLKHSALLSRHYEFNAACAFFCFLTVMANS